MEWRARDESECHFELECGDLHILCTHGDMERRVERLLTISQSRLSFMFFYYLVQSIVGGRCTQNASNKAEAGWRMRTQGLWDLWILELYTRKEKDTQQSHFVIIQPWLNSWRTSTHNSTSVMTRVKRKSSFEQSETRQMDDSHKSFHNDSYLGPFFISQCSANL